MLTGRVVRFDEVRGFGFIAPDDGGEDVFVHANVLGNDKWALAPGVPVEYDAVESERGLKAVAVRVIRNGTSSAGTPGAITARSTGGNANLVTGSSAAAAGSGDEDDGMCDVLSERAFLTEIAEALIDSMPDLTLAQMAEIRRQMLILARRHGWVDG